MMGFLIDHPIWTMAIYLLFISFVIPNIYFWIEDRGERKRLKRQIDEHSEFIGHESYRGEGEE